MTYQGNVYNVLDDAMGNMIITRKWDGANCFLQGDDATTLRTDIEAMWNSHYDELHPSGPFKTFEQHLDMVLDAYESIIR